MFGAFGRAGKLRKKNLIHNCATPKITIDYRRCVPCGMELHNQTPPVGEIVAVIVMCVLVLPDPNFENSWLDGRHSDRFYLGI